MRRVVVPSLRHAATAGAAALLVACGLGVVGGAESGGLDPAGTDAAAAAQGGDAVEADGSAGADAAVDDGGDLTVDPYTTRVSAGLVALYDFEENAGATAHDAVAPAYDLAIEDTTKTAWHPHYLELTDYTSLSNAATFDELVAACAATHEVTVEAWLKVASVAGGNATYGRFVSIIEDSNNRDVDMGIHGNKLWASVLSADTQIEQGPSSKALTHVVLTRAAADQTLRLYVDGALLASQPGVGDPASFAAYRLFVANSFNGDRGIKGELHLVAFYRNALSAADVVRNHAAGPDPAK